MNDSGLTRLLEGVENFVLLNTLLSGGALVAVWSLRLSGWVQTWHPLRQARLYASAIVAPTLVSAWLVLASLLPFGWITGAEWRTEHEATHSLHLIRALTVPVDPFLQYVTVLFLAVAAALVFSAAVRAYIRITALVRCLEIDGEPIPANRIDLIRETCRQNGIEVGLVFSRRPFAFVWGYLKSKLILSTGLLAALTTEELAALLEHEVAHHRRRDNLLRWILSLCRHASFAFAFTGALQAWWNQAVELVCDEVAAERADPCEVAGALVKIKRLVSLAPSVPSGHSAFLGDDQNALEQRVRRLLAGTPETVRMAGLASPWTHPALWVSAFFAATLAGVFWISPMAVHRLLERLLH
jgi:Zn-dependent protease with chaperone function